MSTNDQDTEKNKLDVLKLAHERDLGKVEFLEEIASDKINWKERKIHGIIDFTGIRNRGTGERGSSSPEWMTEHLPAIRNWIQT